MYKDQEWKVGHHKCSLSCALLDIGYWHILYWNLEYISHETIAFRYFQELRRGKYCEVVFPGIFTQCQPWGGEPVKEWEDYRHEYPVHLRDGSGFTKIPIMEVCHVTHDREAEMICSTRPKGYYTFKPIPKLGKQYGDDTLPLGETYAYDQAQKNFYEIPRAPHLRVFPGYFSWWGVSVTRWYGQEDAHVKSLILNINSLEDNNIHTAKYLKSPPELTYGNNSFKISFSSLLRSYRESRIRTDQSKSEDLVTLRVGGTLRYKHEICYVVIVSLEQDSVQLNKYPTIVNGHSIFESNGLVSLEGTVPLVDESKFLEFKAEYIISSIQDRYDRWQSFSWENVVFALYFASGDSELHCKADEMTRDPISHGFCTSTRKVPTGERLCPNKC